MPRALWHGRTRQLFSQAPLFGYRDRALPAMVPRPSVNTWHFRVPSAAGCCGVFLAATALRLGIATMALRLSPYPAIGGYSPSLCSPWLGGGETLRELKLKNGRCILLRCTNTIERQYFLCDCSTIDDITISRRMYEVVDSKQ